MKSMRVLCVVLAACCWAALARAATPAATGFTVDKLADGVYVLSGPENNLVASVGDDGIVLVDALTNEVSDALLTTLKTLSTKPLRYVINTHLHGDHTGGNVALQKLAPVIAHRQVRQRLSTGQENIPEAGWPSITFTDELSLHLNNEDIRVFKAPAGHTDGDIVVIFERAKAVAMGDVFIAPGVSFGDRHSGGSFLGLIEELEYVLPKIPSDAKIVPGHGAISTRDDVARGLQILKEMKAVIEQGIREGKTRDQLVAEKPLEKWKPSIPWFMSSTDGYVKNLYNELTAKPAGQ